MRASSLGCDATLEFFENFIDCLHGSHPEKQLDNGGCALHLRSKQCVLA
jgi:hypothetical protein